MDAHIPDVVEHRGVLSHAVTDPAELAAEARVASERRRRQRLSAAAVAFVVLALAAAAVAQVAFTNPPPAAPAPVVAVSAQAVGVTVLRPGAAPERIAVAQPVAGVASSDAGAIARHAIDEAGSLVVSERVSTSGSLSLSARTASSGAKVEHVQLLGGRVELRDASIQASASSADGRASGSITLGAATTVLVDGRRVIASPNRQVAIEGVGTVLLDEQAVLSSAPEGDAQTGPRHRVVGAILHLRITRTTDGLPAGTEVIVGRVEAGVRDGTVERIDHPAPAVLVPPGGVGAPAATGAGTGVGGPQLGATRPGETSLPRRPSLVRGTAAAAGTTAGAAYVFPVLGTTNFTDTWGAARASTGIPHQGTDIFAQEGTPIVAVADGTLDRVGWNTIGGYRFWLTDDAGNAFYHAHLSAFSPIATDGARVQRGDVIGFVGHTGDAQGTPPHLHFEVHPGAGQRRIRIRTCCSGCVAWPLRSACASAGS